MILHGKHGNGGEKDPFIAMLLDKSKSPHVRASLLATQFLAQMENPAGVIGLLTKLVEQIDQHERDPNEDANQLKQQYERALAELVEGAARPATFIELAESTMPGATKRAHVVTPDGQERYPTLHPDVKAEELFPGQDLFLDAKGSVVLGVGAGMPRVGQQAVFLRSIPDSNEVEVQIRDEKVVLYASRSVIDLAERGALRRDDRLLYCPQRRFAFAVIPEDTDRTYRFVDVSKIPDVRIARDIGDVHPCLGWLVRRARLLIFGDAILKRFDMRKRVSILMIGGPGTGKTYSIKGFICAFNEMIVERAGRTDVGSRVIRVKMSDLLSKWLGDTDKNIDRLFDDIMALGSQPVETADGEQIILPIIVIIEEADGIGAHRTNGDESTAGAMDRIITTLLQRLDDPIDEIGHLPCVFISTSNKPGRIDAGIFRRLGGRVARFRRLDREAFASVLEKRIRPDYPMASRNGDGQAVLRSRAIDEVVCWLWSPNGDDHGLLELTLADGTKLTKYRKDFITPALVEQALSTAIDELAFAADATPDIAGELGLNSSLIIDALAHHVDTVADTVTKFNAVDFLDLPEGVRIDRVQRLRSPVPNLGELLD